MQHDEFEDVIYETIRQLPAWVQEALHDVVILVCDEAGQELDPEGDGLLGLYTGIPLPDGLINAADIMLLKQAVLQN